MIDLAEITERVWANKLAKGFNTTNVELEFNLTYGELAEAYDSHRKHKDDVGEELADVAIYLLSLAKMLGVDLEATINHKMGKNEQRVYVEQTVNGHRVRLKATEEPHQHHEGGRHV